MRGSGRRSAMADARADDWPNPSRWATIEPAWSDERARTALAGVGRKRRRRVWIRSAGLAGLVALAATLGLMRRAPPPLRFADGSVAEPLDRASRVVPGETARG